MRCIKRMVQEYQVDEVYQEMSRIKRYDKNNKLDEVNELFGLIYG